jgi:hypothetical protein
VDLLELVLQLAIAWRLVLGAIAGLSVAFVLSLVFPHLPHGAWFLLGFLGASVGVLWHAIIHSSKQPTSPATLSLPQKTLMFLAVAAMGGLWGALVQSALGTTAAVVAVLITPAILGPILGALSKEKLGLWSIALATVASILGFSTPHAINLLFQAAA